MTIGCFTLVFTSVASADYTWDGLFACDQVIGCSYYDGWHQANWTTGPPEAADPNLGVLTFPGLPNCGAGACYSSMDDLSFSMSASAIDIDDAVGYTMQSDDGLGTQYAPALGLGAGGITATPTAEPNASAGQGGVYWDQPLTLTAPQTWTITGNGTWEDTAFNIYSPITAGGANPSADTVNINLSQTQHLFLEQGFDAGAVTVSGADTSDAGYEAYENGTLITPNLNGNDGSPVTINDVDYLIAPNTYYLPHTQTVGPLTVNGGLLQVGDTTSPDAIFDVDGGVTLNSSSVTQTAIDQSGGAPGTAFAQMSATGNVSLGGTLIPDANLSCNMGAGDVATPIITTGSLSGTFSNAPNGAMLPIPGCWETTQGAIGVQVGYTGHAMTETVVPSSSTSTLLTANPLTPTSGQSVTLTANVYSAYILYYGPAGTVEFMDGTTPIPGCSAQALTATAASAGYATCTATIPASEMADLRAVFTPSSGSLIDGSTSRAPGAGAGNTGSGSAGGGAGAGNTGSGSAGGGGSASGAGTGGGASGGGSGGGSGAGGGSSSSGSSVTPSTVTAATAAIPKLGSIKQGATAVGVPVTCVGGVSCTVSVSLSVTEKLEHGRVTAVAARAAESAESKTKSRVVTLGHVTTSVPAGAQRTLTVSLDAAGKRLLRQRHRLAVKLAISSAGRALSTKVLTFKAR